MRDFISQLVDSVTAVAIMFLSIGLFRDSDKRHAHLPVNHWLRWPIGA